MSTIRFSVQEDIPVIAEADVAVIGGGPGGLGAAVMAARYGAKVVLAERYGLLGGMATFGEVTPFMYNHYKEDKNGGIEDSAAMDRPVYGEWVKKMLTYLPDRLRNSPAYQFTEKVNKYQIMTISKDIAPMAAEDLCLEAGVRIMYHHNLVGAIVNDGVIEAAVFSTKSGFVAIKAKAFVDTTGDADLTVLAGGKTEFGGPSGYCQPMTLCFKLDHVDHDRLPAWNDWQPYYEKAKAEGRITCPRENVLHFGYFDNDVVHFNTTRIVKRSAVDANDLSEAELEGHRQFREFLEFLRSDVPGFENAQIRSIASHIGVRESRRIVGIACGTRADFDNRARYEDAILRCNYDIDIHSPTGSGTDHSYMDWSEYYEIPYGCVVPKGLKNLTVGGRPVSVDHAIHASIRVMPPACSLGQAAGMAAAMSAKSGIPCDELDGKQVRAELKKQGAFL